MDDHDFLEAIPFKRLILQALLNLRLVRFPRNLIYDAVVKVFKDM